MACWRWRLAMLGISIYIWVRFEWQFGIGALFALVHDVTLTLGLFALTGWSSTSTSSPRC